VCCFHRYAKDGALNIQLKPSWKKIAHTRVISFRRVQIDACYPPIKPQWTLENETPRTSEDEGPDHDISADTTSQDGTSVTETSENITPDGLMALIVDKHRPRSLDSLTYHEELSERLRSLVCFQITSWARNHELTAVT
jgi:hypothetical protein